jgi:hypothetical protein
MAEYYTFKQAMDRLEINNTITFLDLVRKYPEAFVNINPGPDKENNPRYDKVTLDRFWHEYINQGKP